MVLHYPVIGSNHCPIFISMTQKSKYGKGNLSLNLYGWMIQNVEKLLRGAGVVALMVHGCRNGGESAYLPNPTY